MPCVVAGVELDVEMHGWHYKVDVRTDVFGQAVFVTGQVRLAGNLVLVDLVFGVQEIFYLGDGGVKLDPVPAR